MNKLILGVLLSISALTPLSASANEVTFQSVVYDPNGARVNDTGLTVRALVLGDLDGVNNCRPVLKEEAFTGVNITDGYLNLVLGSGSAGALNPATPVAQTELFDSNRTYTNLKCVDDNNVEVTEVSYTATSPKRSLRVAFTLTNAANIIADFNLRSVTSALSAENAKKIDGRGLSDLLLKPTGCSTSDILRFDGTSWGCVTQVIKNVVAGTGIEVVDGSDSTISVKYGTTAGTAAEGNDSRILNAIQAGAKITTAALENVIDLVDSGDLVQLDANGKLPVVDGSNLTDIPYSSLVGLPTLGSMADEDQDNYLAKSELPVCNTSQTLVYNSVSDLLTCENINLTVARITDFPAAALVDTRNADNINAGTLNAARLPALTGGDVTSSAGSATLTLANVGTAGTYSVVTTDAKGRVVSGSNPTTLAGYGITDAVSNTETIPANRGGTGITAAPANGEILIGNGTSWTKATITAGTGITITNSAGGITVAASGSASVPPGTLCGMKIVGCSDFGGGPITGLLTSVNCNGTTLGMTCTSTSAASGSCPSGYTFVSGLISEGAPNRLIGYCSKN